jgi:DNA-binding SARP family transcriptional activator
MDGDLRAFPRLLESASTWLNDYTVDVIAMHAINTLPDDAPLSEARRYFQRVSTPGLAVAAYARRLSHHGQSDEALRLIDEALATFSPRAYQLYLTAARYRVSRADEDLDAYIRLTTAGARLLPGLVPIDELPAARPELGGVYPLDTVLASGWKEAVVLRLAELPDLELQVLGRFELRFAERIVEMTERHRQLVVLFLLGLSREEVAEAIWPEADVAKQRNNMGVQFSLLRRVLEPWGVTKYVHEDGLRNVKSDHARLLAALQAGDAERVVALYREPFAPGLDLEPVEDHRGWLRERAVTVLVEAAEASDQTRAVNLLAKVIELDPLNEEALCSLLRRLVGRGRLREAQRHFGEFSRRLHEEMGLEPLPETRAVLEPA